MKKEKQTKGKRRTAGAGGHRWEQRTEEPKVEGEVNFRGGGGRLKNREVNFRDFELGFVYGGNGVWNFGGRRVWDFREWNGMRIHLGMRSQCKITKPNIGMGCHTIPYQ